MKKLCKLCQTMVFVMALSFITHEAIAQLYINELMLSNATTIKDPDYGSKPDWIELYNGGAAEFDLGGYYITKNVDKKSSWWKLPSGTKVAGHGYLLIWADKVGNGLHTNFKLGSDGEQVVLLSPDGEILDKVDCPAVPTDISYGRTVDGEYTWALLQNPTPGAANIETVTKGIAPEPVFSLAAGFYDDNQKITLSTNLKDAVIRYTTDGSMPTENSSKYIEPITAKKRTGKNQYTKNNTIGTKTVDLPAFTIKARVFHKDYLPSRTVGNTYFIGMERNITLPIVVLTTDAKYLWSDEEGMCVRGTKGICGRGEPGKVNWNQSWEYPMYVEYFDANKKQQISQTCGASLMGGWSRSNAQKSFNLKADKEYDQIDRFHYKFWEYRDFDEVQSITLRNTGNDWTDDPQTTFRDALTHVLCRGQLPNLDYQEYQPAVVFINGEYWGIQNVRERLNKHYVGNNHPEVDKSNLDFIKNNYANTVYDDCDPSIKINNVKEGDALHYEALLNILKNEDMSSTSVYNRVKAMIDIDEYIDYLIVNTFVSNNDWPHNNQRFWRERTLEGKWRWILFDTDFGWGIWGENAEQPTLLRALGEADVRNSWSKAPEWATVVFSNLVKNDAFVKEFVQRYMAHLSYTFNASRVESTVNSMASVVAEETKYHHERWGFYHDGWEGKVQKMIDWTPYRIKYVTSELLDRFGYKNKGDITISTYGNGDVAANGCHVISGKKATFVTDIPLNLVAEAKPGYQFVGWMEVTGEPKAVSIIPKKSTWKYNDKGIDLHSTDWKLLSYDDSNWKEGVGRLGYGDDGETTVLGYGGDKDNRYPTYYFRKKITISDPTSLSSLVMGITYDDGAVIYVNGVEVSRWNMPSGETKYDQLALGSINDPDETKYFETTISSEPFVKGDNEIAVEIHQFSKSQSTDMGFDMYLEAKSGLPTGVMKSTNQKLSLKGFSSDYKISAVFEKVKPLSNIVINEVMASNKSILKDNFGEYEDWIEIYNAGSTAANIGGCYITDDLNNHTLYRIPTTCPDSTTIPAGGYLVLFADGSPEQGVLHVGFNLSADGESVGLYQPTGEDVITLDEITFQSQTKDVSYGSFPNGSKTRMQLMPTPGSTNVVLELISNLYINEFMASNNGTLADESGEIEDWIEVYNAGSKDVDMGGLYFTDDLTKPQKYRIPTTDPKSTTVPAGGYLIFWADSKPEKGVLHLDFGLSGDGESIGLGQNTGAGVTFIDQVTFGAQVSDVAFARFPNGTGDFQPFYNATPMAENKFADSKLITGLYINEIATENTKFLDEADESDDWVEIYNSNDFDVDLAGLFVTDSLANKSQYRISSLDSKATTIPAHGYYILWTDNNKKQGVNHVGFKLTSKGESFGIYQAVDNELLVVDTMSFGQQFEDITFGRFADASDNLEYLKPTPKAENQKLDARSVICEVYTSADTLDFMMSPDQTDYVVNLIAETISINALNFKSPYSDVVIKYDMPTSVNGQSSVSVNSPVDGDIVYEIDFVKAISNDATLASISVNIGALSPKFSADVTEYTLKLDAATASAVPLITAVPTSFLSSVAVSQAVAAPGLATVLVTAEDGSENIYYINIEMDNEFALIPWKGSWKYSSGTNYDEEDWTAIDFDDSKWKSGASPLGYGRADIATTVSYGSNADKRYPTYYFRNTIEIAKPEDLQNLQLGLREDDGAVVYINGNEVLRVGMGEGEISYNNLSVDVCDKDDDCEADTVKLELSPDMFVAGINVVAVEIHQATLKSTDMIMECAITAERYIKAESYVQNLDLKEGWNLISFNVTNSDMSPATIFADVIDDVEVVKDFDLQFVPNAENNTLPNIRDGKAYFVKMKKATKLNIEGMPLHANSIAYSLTEGWNLVGFPAQTDMNIGDVIVNSLVNKIRVIKTDEVFYNPSLFDYQNSLQKFEPGKGYLFNLKTSTIFQFPVD